MKVTATGDVYYNSATLTGNTVTLGNNKLNSHEIVKLDSVTHNPLSGAMFTVNKANGERIGSYRTDASGKILIPDLSEGTYVISETAVPNGYILSDAPKSVNISGGKLVSVEFLNKPMSSIEIVRLDAITHKPLQGAALTVTKSTGECIGTFRTEADGKVAYQRPHQRRVCCRRNHHTGRLTLIIHLQHLFSEYLTRFYITNAITHTAKKLTVFKSGLRLTKAIEPFADGRGQKFEQKTRDSRHDPLSLIKYMRSKLPKSLSSNYD